MDNYKKQFVEGNDYEGTVKDTFDKGAIVLLSDEVEAFVPKRHSTKQDGSVMVSGEILEFRVLEFSVENKKILVSHTATYNDEIVAEKKKRLHQQKSYEAA